MKLYQTFDCQDMPKEVMKEFFEYTDYGYSNDCYIMWYTDEDLEVVTNWLRAQVDALEPEVLIHRWW